MTRRRGSKLQFSHSEPAVMYEPAVIAIFLGTLLSLNQSTISLSRDNENDYLTSSDRESTYNVTTSIIDDVKETIFTIKLKCRGRTNDIVACRLVDPQYQTIYHVSPCKKTIELCTKEHLRADNSYIGRFEIKHRSSRIERLTVGTGTSLKQLSFYRLMAGHLFPGVDVTGKPEGTYSLIEESVYGKCEALVKIVRSRIKNEGPENERIGKFVLSPRDENGNDTNEREKIVNEMLSIKRTRNLETCYPVPGLLIFDSFFYHPLMTSVHYEVKSSISRIILRDRAFTSYTTEDIAMKNIERPDGNTTMLHVRTSLTLHSIVRIDEPIALINDPVSVELPFIDGFNPIEKNNVTNIYNNNNTNSNINNNDNNYTSEKKIQ